MYGKIIHDNVYLQDNENLVSAGDFIYVIQHKEWDFKEKTNRYILYSLEVKCVNKDTLTVLQHPRHSDALSNGNWARYYSSKKSLMKAYFKHQLEFLAEKVRILKPLSFFHSMKAIEIEELKSFIREIEKDIEGSLDNLGNNNFFII